MSAQQLLEQLTELYAQLDLLNIDREKAKQEIIPQDVRDALEALALEYSPKQEAVGQKIAELEAQVKDEVIASGQTAKGGALQAVYTKGRVSWDSKVLDGLMIAVPELEKARKQGEPSVSIRRTGGK